MATTTNKNSMLPTFQGRYSDMIGGISHGDISSPCWFWVEDRNDLAFIHWETINGVKTLVPHVILWEKVTDLKNKVDELSDGLVDPTSGEQISVVTYVTESVAPVQTQVTNVATDVEEIKQNGAAIMITPKTTGGGNNG